MTSPTQLKYLEAMGIPVWVSRDLIVRDVKLESKTDIKIETGEASSGAQSILQNLQEKSEKTRLKPKVTADVNQKNEAASIHKQAIESPPLQKQANNIAQTSSYAVYGLGDLDAQWLIIGESPEFMLNHSSQPFSDASRVLLNNMLYAVGLETPYKQAYLMNVLKITQSDVGSEDKHKLNTILRDKIEQIKPKIILLVGQLAAQNLLQTNEPLARLRGVAKTLVETEIPIVVTYYPDYLLSKQQDKRKAWNDLKLAKSLIDSS